MADPFAHGTPVGDFHSWIKPAPAPCQNCECCSARLCERGRKHAFGCGAVAAAEDWVTVRGCPCSAETTEGTEAHRAAQARAAKREQAGDPPAYPEPGSLIPGQPGYVVGTCGHRVAGSEWRAGFRTCERCPADADDGEVSES